MTASLRSRLLAGMVVLVAAGLSVAAAVTYEEQRSFLLARVHQQVLSALAPISAQLRLDRFGNRPRPATGGPARPPGGFFDPSFGRGRGRALAILPPGTFGELRGPTGTVVRRRTFTYDGSHPPTPVLPAHLPLSRRGQAPRLFTIPARAGSPRYEAVAFTDGHDTAIIAVPLREVDDTLRRLILVQALVGGGVILGLIALGWLVIRIGLRPLERIGRTASEIAGGDYARRVTPADGRTEVGRLGRSLNEMLAQIEQAFEDRAHSESRLRLFLADASHELRTPLAAIRGYAELFRMGATGDAETLQRAMSRIEAESARMGVLVEELLLLAQLDQQPVSREARVDLVELVDQAVQDARVIAPGRTIGLDATDADVVISGEPDRLRQLMANLLRNAILHTPEATAIAVSVGATGGRAAITVRDHGPGLPDGAEEQVFERFWRTEDGRRRGRAGAGLGLAIVKAIATAHGGEVTAGGAPGGGAVFTVVLPLAPRPVATAARNPPPAGHARSRPVSVSGDSQASRG